MTVIPVPRPSKDARNPNRAMSGLLLAQIQHLQHAERRLPLQYRSKIYTHAIRTEGEAATYIRAVTEAIHQAHHDAITQRTRRQKKGLAIAAAAAGKSSRKRSSSNSKKKRGSAKPRKK